MTVFACLGVVAVLSSASSSFRSYLPAVPLTAERQPPRGVAVASASPSRSAAASRSPAPTATAPVRGSRPAAPSTPAPAAPPAAPTAAPTAKPARCTAGSATVTAVADTYVDQAEPGANFGSAENLVVVGRNKERNRRALVRFTLPSVPSGCTLRSAVLTLSAKDASGRRILVSRAARAWRESAVTWATAPAATGTASSATVTASDVRWTVTAQVAAMRTSGNYGFVLRDSVENQKGEPTQTNFTARTGRGAPVLVLRWS